MPTAGGAPAEWRKRLFQSTTDVHSHAIWIVCVRRQVVIIERATKFTIGPTESATVRIVPFHRRGTHCILKRCPQDELITRLNIVRRSRRFWAERTFGKQSRFA